MALMPPSSGSTQPRNRSNLRASCLTLSKHALNILTAGTAKVISEKELKEKLELGRPLRIKLGVDPTAPDIHLGTHGGY